MPYPSDNQVGNNSYVEFASVASGSLIPTEYTVTAAATASVAATSISVTADTEFTLRHGATLTFSGGGSATVAIASTSASPPSTTLKDAIVVGTSATSIPVTALATEIAISETATTYPMRILLGTTEVSPSQNLQSVPASDTLSGFGARNVVTAADRVLSINGNKISNDRCFYEILDPYLNQDSTIQGLLYARAVLANGDTYEGPVRLSSASGANPNRALRTYTMEVTFQGESGTLAGQYQFTAGDASSFA